MNPIHICLIEPEIPQNTGNIARTCAVTGASLHLVKPFGFEITSTRLKRAGLDYWDKLDITYYECLEDFLERHRDDPLYFFSQKGKENAKITLSKINENDEEIIVDYTIIIKKL